MTKPRVLIYEGPEETIFAYTKYLPLLKYYLPTADMADCCPVCGSDDVVPLGEAHQDWFNPPFMRDPKRCRACLVEFTVRYVAIDVEVTDIPREDPRL